MEQWRNKSCLGAKTKMHLLHKSLAPSVPIQDFII